VWGGITGTLSNQTDLQTALNGKQASGNYLTALTGDCTATGPGAVAITCTESGGVAFGTGAFATIANYLTIATAASTYEPLLGNPSTNGYLLSSTSAGVRSWVAPYTLPGTVVQTNQANAYGAYLQDFSSATQVKHPVAAGYAALANGEIGYDSTNLNWHAWDNGADWLVGMMPKTGLTNNHCAEFALSGNTWTLADAGGTCMTGGSMVWPTTAGIVYWTSGTTWAGAYNSSTPIPANYLPAALSSSTSINSTTIPASSTLATISGSPVSPNVACFSASTSIVPCTSANIQTAIGASAYALLTGAAFTGTVIAPTVGVGTSVPLQNLSVANAGSTLPAAGSGVGAIVAFLAGTTNNGYGTLFGQLATGHGYIQEQRVDGTATTYPLELNPNGSDVLINTETDCGSALCVNGAASATAFISTVATGTAPFTVASTTQVLNLHAATAGGIATSGTANQLWGMNSGGTAQGWQTSSAGATRAATQNNVAFPTGPASISSYTMQGLAASITPAVSGNILITISGEIYGGSLTAAGDGINYNIAYGTGTAPTNGAASTGTAPNSSTYYTNPTTVTSTDVSVPFSTTAVVTGLTLNTAYWVDLQAKAQIATGFSLRQVSVSIIEN